MRVDREAFLLAAWTLAGTFAGCERADEVSRADETTVAAPAVKAERIAPEGVTSAPGISVAVPAPIEQANPPAPSVPAPATPTAKSVRSMSASKRWFLGLAVAQRNNVTSVCDSRREKQCQAILRRMMPRAVEDDDALDALDAPAAPAPPEDPDDPQVKFLAGLTAPQRQQVSRYCEERNARMPAPTCETPLVVAFDNQPIDFLAAGAEQFAFVPGEPMTTDWPTAATPWIAHDLDHDGAITSGAELFGSSTVLAGGTTARNGFEALARLDANADGTVDNRDPAFAELLLWSDRNGDHRSTPDELRRLSSVVTAIPLAHAIDVRCTARDNCEGERGTLRWRDAADVERTGAVVDIYLRRR